MPRRVLLILLALLLFLAPAAQGEGYWTQLPSELPECREDRPGCFLLQMAMTGTFAALDVEDSISVRVFSAVLPQLCALTEEDLSHFAASFGVDMERLRRVYHIALGNCLLAEIRQGGDLTPDEASALRVLQLFLYPEGEKDPDTQKAIIRAQMNDDILTTLANSAALPRDFIDYLIRTEDWNVLVPETE